MKSIKKFSLAAFLALIGLGTLASCGEKVPSAAETVLSKILLVQEGEDVEADFTVPKTVKYNSELHEITWSSNNEAVLSFADNTDSTKYTADIHRPFDANTDVVLTASATVDGKTATVDFKTTVKKIDGNKALSEAINQIGLKSAYQEKAEVNLPAKSDEYKDEITFSYVLDGEYTSTTLADNKLTMDPTLASEDVKLKVTATAGSVTVEETLKISVTSALFIEGMPYVLSLVQGKVDNKVLYLTGEMSGYYAATTNDATKAMPIYVEKTTGGYHMYFVKGADKSYINMVASGTYVNIKFEAAASTVWTLNNVYNTMVSEVNGEMYYIGCSNTYETIGPSKLSYAETAFPCHLEVSTALPYTMSLVQGNLENKTLYATGKMSGYYGETTEDATKAAPVYFAAVEGGYHMYFLEGTTKKYMNVVASGTHINFKIEDAPTSVWAPNATAGTFTTKLNDVEYYLGTSKTYNTISPSTIDKAPTSFVCTFALAKVSEGPTSEAVEVPADAVVMNVKSDPVKWYNEGETADLTTALTTSTAVTVTAVKNDWEVNPEHASTSGYAYISKSDLRLYAAKEGTNGSALKITATSGTIKNLYLTVSSGELTVLVNGQEVTLKEGTTNLFEINAAEFVIQNTGSKVAKISAFAVTLE